MSATTFQFVILINRGLQSVPSTLQKSCFLLGVGRQSHLSAVFRKRFQQTPRSWAIAACAPSLSRPSPPHFSKESVSEVLYAAMGE